MGNTKSVDICSDNKNDIDYERKAKINDIKNSLLKTNSCITCLYTSTIVTIIHEKKCKGRNVKMIRRNFRALDQCKHIFCNECYDKIEYDYGDCPVCDFKNLYSGKHFKTVHKFQKWFSEYPCLLIIVKLGYNDRNYDVDYLKSYEIYNVDRLKKHNEGAKNLLYSNNTIYPIFDLNIFFKKQYYRPLLTIYLASDIANIIMEYVEIICFILGQKLGYVSHELGYVSHA